VIRLREYPLYEWGAVVDRSGHRAFELATQNGAKALLRESGTDRYCLIVETADGEKSELSGGEVAYLYIDVAKANKTDSSSTRRERELALLEKTKRENDFLHKI